MTRSTTEIVPLGVPHQITLAGRGYTVIARVLHRTMNYNIVIPDELAPGEPGPSGEVE